MWKRKSFSNLYCQANTTHFSASLISPSALWVNQLSNRQFAHAYNWASKNLPPSCHEESVPVLSCTSSFSTRSPVEGHVPVPLQTGNTLASPPPPPTFWVDAIFLSAIFVFLLSFTSLIKGTVSWKGETCQNAKNSENMSFQIVQLGAGKMTRAPQPRANTVLQNHAACACIMCALRAKPQTSDFKHMTHTTSYWELKAEGTWGFPGFRGGHGLIFSPAPSPAPSQGRARGAPLFRRVSGTCGDTRAHSTRHTQRAILPVLGAGARGPRTAPSPHPHQLHQLNQ